MKTLRWILVLPAGLAAFAACQIIAIITSAGIDTYEFGLGTAWSQFLSSLACPICFVYFGAKTAPREKFIVSLVLAMIYAVFTGVILHYYVGTHPSGWTAGWYLFSIAIGLFGAGWACHYFHMNWSEEFREECQELLRESEADPDMRMARFLLENEKKKADASIAPLDQGRP